MLCKSTTPRSIAGEDDLRIFPNPTNGILSVDFREDRGAKRRSIKVYDLAGKLLHSEILTSTRNKVSLAHLDSGVLYYEIIENGVQISIGKQILIR